MGAKDGANYAADIQRRHFRSCEWPLSAKEPLVKGQLVKEPLVK